MLGVVLWSDSRENKAVIWCEDHGDLAYFDGTGGVIYEGLPLDAGDLVSFEMEYARDLRLARNMRRIERGSYEGIGERLATASGPAKPARKPTSSPAHPTAEIVQFAPRRDGERVGALVPA